MKTKHITPIEEIEQEDIYADPLQKLNKPLTKALDQYYTVSVEDDDGMFSARKNPEYQAVEKFLAEDLNNMHYHASNKLK